MKILFFVVFAEKQKKEAYVSKRKEGRKGETSWIILLLSYTIIGQGGS
jgi:hypothetical protein